jgi:hypothetical protein
MTRILLPAVSAITDGDLAGITLQQRRLPASRAKIGHHQGQNLRAVR